MNTYQIKIVSLRNSVILIFVLLTIFIGGIILFNDIVKQIPTIIFILLAMTIAYFSWQKFVTGRTEWTIDKAGIYMTWIKQFYFSSEDDIKLKWNEIESIKQGFDPNYYTLKIKFISGEKIKFYHDNLTTKDDFKEFIKILNQTFSEMRVS